MLETKSMVEEKWHKLGSKRLVGDRSCNLGIMRGIWILLC